MSLKEREINNNPLRAEEALHHYFGCKVLVYRCLMSVCQIRPWRFELIASDERHFVYSGTYNHSISRAQAAKVPWWRAKFMADGYHEEQYQILN